MTITVLAAHPAQVAFVPRRGSKTRSLMSRMHTPVIVPEASGSEFERPGSIPGAACRDMDIEPWIRGDGTLWRPVRHPAARIGAEAPAVTRDDLLRYLEATLDGAHPAFRALTLAFEASPLSVRLASVPYANGAVDLHRGWAGFTEAEVNRFVLDERPMCAAAVAAFVAEEVLVADGIALSRFRPTLRMALGSVGATEEVVVHRGFSAARPSFRIDGRADAVAYCRARRPHVRIVDGEPGTLLSDRVMALMPTVPADDHDVVSMANAIPGAFRTVLTPFARDRRDVCEDLHASLMAMDARLAELERLGNRGLVGAEGAVAALETMRDAGMRVRGAARHTCSTSHYDRFIEALLYVDGVALPRMRKHDLADDADALAALAI